MMLHLPPADFSSPNYGICRRNFRFHWFSFAFVAATLIGMMIAAAMGQGLHYSRPFWIGERRECTCTLWHCMQLVCCQRCECRTRIAHCGMCNHIILCNHIIFQMKCFLYSNSGSMVQCNPSL